MLSSIGIIICTRVANKFITFIIFFIKYVSVCVCVRVCVFTLCLIYQWSILITWACVSIEFIFVLDMNNKLVIINFVCYTILGRLNLMWKCGNSRTHISYSHTTRHPHDLILTLTPSRFHFPTHFLMWARLSDNPSFHFMLSFCFHCFAIAFMKFQGLVNVILLFCFIWPQSKTTEKKLAKKLRNRKTHQLVI